MTATDTRSEGSYRIGFDIGGTFTDLVLAAPDGSASCLKVLSSPGNYADAVSRGILALLREKGLAGDVIGSAVHGTTVATNAILERHGAKVGLITTEGFRDVLEIGRLRIPSLYDMSYVRPRPLVERRLRAEVTERIGPSGEIIVPLDQSSVAIAVSRLLEARVESIAVSLIHSYANPAHELAIAETIRRQCPTMPVTLSSDIHPEIGEFERTSTAVANSYVMPLMEHYLVHLGERLESLGISSIPLIMQSNGGAMSIAGARSRPVLLIESGPAAGVVATAALARRIGTEDVISVDIGGTTAKASVVEGGSVKHVGEFQIGGIVSEGSRLNNGGGFVIRAPAIDLAEVGAGGGSIISVDAVKSLKVGPRSAGAVPGPVAYDSGGEFATLTDANLCLGYLNPERLPSGLRLNASKAQAAIADQVAAPLDLPLAEAAFGAYQVGSASMARAVRSVTIERGLDPRAFAIVAFGGNGPLFAAAMARSLEVRTVIVPPAPGVFSAVGLLEAEIERHFSRSFLKMLSDVTADQIVSGMSELFDEARNTLASDGIVAPMVCEGTLDMRYRGQSHHLPVKYPAQANRANLTEELIQGLAEEHTRQFGFSGDPAVVQIVNLRAAARWVRRSEPTVVRSGVVVEQGSARTRNAYFGRVLGWLDTPVIERASLQSDPRPGPLLIEEYDATTLVPPGARARTDQYDNIILDVGAT